MSAFRRLFGALVATALFAPGLAAAQTISFGDVLDHLEGDPVGGELTLFTSFDAGRIPFKAVFDGSLETANDLTQTKQTHEFKLEEQSQELTFAGPQFGARWQLSPEIALKGAVGVSWLRLKQSAVSLTTSRFNQADRQEFYDEFTSFQPNPGFSATLGGDYVFISMQRLNVKAGMQITYLSSSGLRGHSIEGSGKIDVAGTASDFEYSESRTTDILLNLLNLQPHVGLEWRPFQSFVVNSFGLYASYVASFSKMKKDFSDLDVDNGTTTIDQTFTADVGVGLKAKQNLGAYYGWYIGIPHFGNLGAELQFGSHTSGSLSYQYYF